MDDSLTVFIISARTVSLLAFVALHFMTLLPFIVAEKTELPILLLTGMLSPVNADSFTVVSPSNIIPSAEIASPALTINTSPTLISLAGIIFSSPSTIIVAVFGVKSIKARRAEVVLPFEYASSILPSVISAKIIAAASKYILCK